MKNNTRKMVMMALFIAISVVLIYLIRFPLFSAASFLEYDAADVPIIICTLMYGPVSGIIVTVIAAVIQGFTVSAKSGIIGILMHIFSTGALVLCAGYIYKRKNTGTSLIIGLTVGVLLMAIIMIVLNLIVTPIYMGVPFKAVLNMILPIILPFNLLKGVFNAVAAAVIYKSVSLIIGKEKNT